MYIHGFDTGRGTTSLVWIECVGRIVCCNNISAIVKMVHLIREIISIVITYKVVVGWTEPMYEHRGYLSEGYTEK